MSSTFAKTICRIVFGTILLHLSVPPSAHSQDIQDMYFDTGAILVGESPDIVPDIRYERMSIGMTQRECAMGGVASFLPRNDYASFEFGTASLGGPLRSSTNPDFNRTNYFNGSQDVLRSPGHHYHSLIDGSDTLVAHPNKLVTNQGILQSISVQGTDPSSRFVSGHIGTQNGAITGSLIDDKSGSPDPGASIAVATFEETYEVGVNRSIELGGALAFNVVLPKAFEHAGFIQDPGAAAVSLSTSIAMAPGTRIWNEDFGEDVFFGGCRTLARMGATVSAGVSDGLDSTANSGPQENFFGNADVGFVMDGSAGGIPLTGGVDIFSTAVNPQLGFGPLDEDYRVASTWNAPKLRFFDADPLATSTKVTFTHTLTMIADPGAQITLGALTDTELASLPNGDNVLWLVGSGTLVPEPQSGMLGIVLGLGLIVARHRQTSTPRSLSVS